MNVLLNFTISVAFYGKLATLSNLKKFTIILGNPIYFFFLKKNQILNILRKFTISVAFYVKLATLSNFEKFTTFFQKAYLFNLKKPNFWTFWEILLFHELRTATLLP